MRVAARQPRAGLIQNCAVHTGRELTNNRMHHGVWFIASPIQRPRPHRNRVGHHPPDHVCRCGVVLALRVVQHRTPKPAYVVEERRARHAAVIDTMPEFLKHVPEARFGHYLMMAGACGGRDWNWKGVRYSDYENATGTSQVHVWFEPDAG